METHSKLLKTVEGLSGRLLCAVSGGADSVALLHLLASRRPKPELYAVHVNHGLRGKASDGDECFVHALCRELDVPLICKQASLTGASEGEAREARYSLFREAMRETGCDAIVLAHHMRDQAETVLEHLMRGAGTDGLCGMAQQSELSGMVILRPLLTVSPDDLRTYLRENGFAWREDASNSDPRYLRNAVRLQLLPQMESLLPGATQRIAAAASLIGKDANHLRHETEAFLHSQGSRLWIRLKPLEALDEAMRRRVLRLWWQRASGETPDLSHTQDMLGLITGSTGMRCSLPMGWEAIRGHQCLHLIPPGQPVEVPDPVPAADGAMLCGVTMRLTASEGTPGNGRTAQELPQGLLTGCVLRTRRTGDRITPFGLSGSQSLQDYLVNRGVDAPFRDRIPLIAQGQNILLVCGVGSGGIPRYDPQQENIRLTWQGEIPWLQV